MSGGLTVGRWRLVTISMETFVCIVFELLSTLYICYRLIVV